MSRLFARLIGRSFFALSLLGLAMPFAGYGAVSFTQQPQSQTVSGGANVLFTVVATGKQPLSYQWYFNDTYLTDGSHIGGAQTSMLGVTNAGLNDIGSYQVVVQDSRGFSATSAAAYLTVNVPPFITAQPQSQTVLASQPASFTVGADGSGPLAYQWYHNDVSVPGATTAALDIPDAQPDSAGSYFVQVGNAFGTTNSSVAVLDVLSPPAITQQPQNQSGLRGTNISFSATVTGTLPLYYQWFFNGVALTNGGRITGASTSVLTLSAIQTSDAGDYFLLVTNVAGSATSAVAHLTVYVPPHITAQPQSQTVLAGQPASFTVGADGTAPLVYQWYHDGVSVPGATTANLYIPNAQPNSAGSYFVTVTNAFGTTNSSVAVLNVLSPPAITQQPQSQSGLQGTSISFSATVSGTLPLYYQWFFNGVALTNGGRIAGVATNVLTLSAIQTSDAGDYFLLVTNSAGSVTSAVAHLTVNVPPYITAQPQSQTVLAGQPVSFTVGADGTSPLSYQWYSNGVSITGATTPAFYIPNAQPGNAGSYFVAVSNSFGVAVSTNAVLAVLTPPAITTQPASQTVILSNNATFLVTATGTPPLSYQWLKDGINLVGATNATLTLSNVQTNDAGQYSVFVSNAFGSLTSEAAVLTVLVPPGILTQPATQTAILNSNVTFSVLASGTEPLGYQWLGNGTNLTDGPHLAGSASPSLTISNVQLADAGSYLVTVTNAAGAVTSAVAVLTVLQPPAILTQPAGHSVALGLPASFSVTVTGTPPLSLQWQLNGADIPGATDTTFAITAAGPADFGVYQAVVSNAAAVAVSAPAPLTLSPVAAWGRNDAGQTVLPPGVSNVVMVAAGLTHSLALRSDGTLVAWGSSAYGQTYLAPDLTNIVAIAAGYNHNLALRANGTVAAWGYNNYGQATVPATLSNVVAIAAGGSHSLALRADGIVVAWGYNAYFQTNVPAGLRQVATIAAGVNYSLALPSNGTVVGWGYNAYGQAAPLPGLPAAVAVAGGSQHSLAVCADGSVAAWGNNSSGQTRVPAGLTNAIAVAAGDSHSLALRSDGSLVAWGLNNYGQTNIPVAWSNLVAISTRGSHNLALVGDGTPLLTRQPVGGTFFAGRSLRLQARAAGAAPLSFQWQHNGVNLDGATNATLLLPSLGLADAGAYQLIVSNSLGAAVSLPVPITVLDGVAPFFLSQLPTFQTNYLSSRVALGLSVGGSGPLWWQWFCQGQPIPGATNEELVFDPLTLTNTGPYYVSVSNLFGRLTSIPDNLKVVQVKVWGSRYIADAPLMLTNAVAVSASSANYLAARSDGTAVAWGSQIGGLLVPKGLSNVVSVAAGGDHNVALRADGSVFVWGSNAYGQTNVPAGLKAVAIAAGNSHDLALRADGTVVAWGQSNYSQTLVPASASNVVAIAAGPYHSLALRSDGAVVGWGQNYYGQAVPLKAGSNFIAIATGTYQSVGLRANGTVFAWSSYYYGAATNVPAGLSNVVAISAGTSHGLALRSDGTVVIWGTYLEQPPATAPSDLANVIRIASGSDSDVAIFGNRAPSVTIPPVNRTLFRGSNATFVAKFVGAPPLQLQWRFNGVDLPGATTDTLSLTNLQPSQSGAYQLVAANAYGQASVSAKLTVTIPLGVALDATNLAWTSTGNAPWYGEADTTFDGIAAAHSGDIGNGQETILQTTAIGPGRLTWWWKVSSEETFDTLEFRLGGVVQTVISGEVDWQQGACILPPGAQTLQWRYSKDATFSDGLDAAWVDQVIYTPDPPLITVQPVGRVLPLGADWAFPVTATGVPPLTYQWLKNGANLNGAISSALTIQSATRHDSGVYALQVSNPGGTVLSSNAMVKVLAPQKLGQPVLLPDGTLSLTSGDADGAPLWPEDLANLEAQASTNLTDWVPLPGSLTLTNGVLQVQDAGRTNYAGRFYRIIEK